MLPIFLPQSVIHNVWPATILHIDRVCVKILLFVFHCRWSRVQRTCCKAWQAVVSRGIRSSWGRPSRCSKIARPKLTTFGCASSKWKPRIILTITMATTQEVSISYYLISVHFGFWQNMLAFGLKAGLHLLVFERTKWYKF